MMPSVRELSLSSRFWYRVHGRLNRLYYWKPLQGHRRILELVRLPHHFALQRWHGEQDRVSQERCRHSAERVRAKLDRLDAEVDRMNADPSRPPYFANGVAYATLAVRRALLDPAGAVTPTASIEHVYLSAGTRLDGFYLSSATCSCGGWQWDFDVAHADSGQARDDWSRHVAAVTPTEAPVEHIEHVTAEPLDETTVSALIRYVDHLPGCGKTMEFPWDCDCGLSALLLADRPALAAALRS